MTGPGGYVVVLFGDSDEESCPLPRCPLGTAQWFPDQAAAAGYARSVPAAFEPHLIGVVAEDDETQWRARMVIAADAILDSAAEYRRHGGLPDDAPLQVGLPADLPAAAGEFLAGMLAPNHVSPADPGGQPLIMPELIMPASPPSKPALGESSAGAPA